MLVAVIHSNANYLIGLRLPIMKEMRSRGMQVLALAPNMEEKHAIVLRKYGIESGSYALRPTGLNPLADLRNMFSLAALLRRCKPDIVLTNNVKPVIFGTFAATIAMVPARFALVSGLGYAFTDDGMRANRKKKVVRWITSRLYAAAFRLNRAVVLQNPDDVAELEAARVLAHGRGRLVAGSGIDTSEFAYADRTGEQPVFVMVARLLLEKGVRNYLEAARMVKAKFPHARFLLVGDTDSNPSALSPEEINGYVEDGTVQWLGHVDDVRPWLYQASIFVLPSYREGLPRSALEAMSTGLALVMTNVPGCKETVQEGLNGLLVPVRDSAALANAMGELAGDMNRVHAMGRHSRAMAETIFEVSKVNDMMCGIMGLPRAMAAQGGFQ